MLTLNCTVCPALTLMSVAKPWISQSPAPQIASHSDAGEPALLFSHAIAFSEHGSTAAAAG